MRDEQIERELNRIGLNGGHAFRALTSSRKACTSARRRSSSASREASSLSATIGCGWAECRHVSDYAGVEGAVHSAIGPTTVSTFWPMADVSQTADGIVAHSKMPASPICRIVKAPRARRC